MTQLDMVLNEVRSIKRMLQTSAKAEVWISETQAIQLTGLSKPSLQKYRASGKIKKWKALPSGRKIQYSKNELEKIFQTT